MAIRELPSSPGMAGLYTRAVAGGLPLVSRLPGVGRLIGPAGGDSALPDLEWRLHGLRVDRSELGSYSRVCGFPLRDQLPITYPHVLAFPLALGLMTAPSFPFPVMGLVHIRNQITQRRPLEAGEVLTVSVRAEGLARHERGRQFDLVAEVRAGDEPAWVGRSTYLRREKGGGSPGERPPEPPTPTRQVAEWRVAEDVGRRYAAVSGDINPIHLHGLSARLFGFPSAIAHGMWQKARCLAALEGRLPEACEVDAHFKRPLRLPSKVAFATEGDGRRLFALRSPGRDETHIVGRVDPA